MGTPEGLFRVGNKLLSRKRVDRCLDKIFQWRVQGFSQQEVADKLYLERTFISRLEKLGEIRKGHRLAVIGFPVENRQEIAEMSSEAGAEYTWIMDNRQRWNLIEGRSALDFFNYAVGELNRLQEFDTIILLTSEKWYQLAAALLDSQIIHYQLGESPLEQDCKVDLSRFSSLLEKINY